MEWSILLPILIPSVIALLAYGFRISIMQRIDNLEQKSMNHVTEQQTRQILNDKLEPLKEDLIEIKEQLNKLFDRLINGAS